MQTVRTFPRRPRLRVRPLTNLHRLHLYAGLPQRFARGSLHRAPRTNTELPMARLAFPVRTHHRCPGEGRISGSPRRHIPRLRVVPIIGRTSLVPHGWARQHDRDTSRPPAAFGMGLRQDMSRHLKRSPSLLLGMRTGPHYAFRPRRAGRVSPVLGQHHRDGTILCTFHSGRMRDRICSPAMGCKPRLLTRLLKRRKGHPLCRQVRCGSVWPCACACGYGNLRRIRPVLGAPGGQTSLRSGFRVLRMAARHSGHPSPHGLTRPRRCVIAWDDLDPDTDRRTASIGPRTACSAGSHLSRSWTGSSEVALSRACGSCRLRRPRTLLDNQRVGRPAAICRCCGPGSPVRESRWDSLSSCIPIGRSVRRCAVASCGLTLPHPLRGQTCLPRLVSENRLTRRVARSCRSPGGGGVLCSGAGE